MQWASKPGSVRLLAGIVGRQGATEALSEPLLEALRAAQKGRGERSCGWQRGRRRKERIRSEEGAQRTSSQNEPERESNGLQQLLLRTASAAFCAVVLLIGALQYLHKDTAAAKRKWQLLLLRQKTFTCSGMSTTTRTMQLLPKRRVLWRRCEEAPRIDDPCRDFLNYILESW